MKDKDFIIWMFENHFGLFDIIKDEHYFTSESFGNCLSKLDEVYELYLNETQTKNT